MKSNIQMYCTFYYHLINERKLQVNTLETIHTVLHPTFQLAVRDDIIRNNPSHGVMSEIKKETREESWSETCVDSRTAESIYELYIEQSGI